MLSVKSINRNVLLTLLLFVTGCQTPMLVFPGKALTGEIADEKEFSALKSPALMRLEVTPNNPYSVIIRTTFIDEQLYIDAAPARKWGKRIALDPHVRIQLDGKIYKATAVRIDDPDIAAKFLKGRIIYRLVPGWDSGNDSR